MSSPVTVRAECDQVLFGIISHLATRADVMDLKILSDAAILAAPPIAREHRAGEFAIRVGVKPESRSLPSELGHSRSSLARAIAAFAPRREHR